MVESGTLETRYCIFVSGVFFGDYAGKTGLGKKLVFLKKVLDFLFVF